VLIVDAQVHIWGSGTPLPPHRPGPVFSKDELLQEMDEAGVTAAVIHPPGWDPGSDRLALEAARQHPDRLAVLGKFPLDRPESRSLMAGWTRQPGMLGLRFTFMREQSELLTSGSADWVWPEAEKAGLTVMFLAPGNMRKFAPIAERHPGLTLIIDHMSMTLEIAKAGKTKEAMDDVVALAKYPNVSVKLSSSPTYSFEPYPFRDMTEHLKRCFDAYGPQRCYWGTDITNALTKCTYRQRVTHFTEELPFLSEEDKDWVMGKAILKRLNWA
jgi:predicted TIM-barrel fold metal-dependent hydrolase